MMRTARGWQHAVSASGDSLMALSFLSRTVRRQPHVAALKGRAPRRGRASAADAETLDEALVAGLVVFLDIIEQLPTQ